MTPFWNLGPITALTPPHVFNLCQNSGGIKNEVGDFHYSHFWSVLTNQGHIFLSHLYSSHQSINFSIKRHGILEVQISNKFKIRSKSYSKLVLSFDLDSIPLTWEESLMQEAGPLWSLLSSPYSGWIGSQNFFHKQSWAHFQGSYCVPTPGCEEIHAYATGMGLGVRPGVVFCWSSLDLG